MRTEWIRTQIACASTRPVITAFVVALAVRLLGVAVVRLLFDGAVYSDAETYAMLAAQAAVGDTAAWQPMNHFTYQETAALLWPVAMLNRVFGADILVGQVYVAMMGALAAAAGAKIGQLIFGPAGGLAAGLLLALLPNQVVWATMPLKDPVVWAIWGLIVLGVIWLMRTRGWGVIGGVALVVAGLMLMETMRDHSVVIACIAMVPVAVMELADRRRVQGIALLTLAVIMPMVLGLGPLGYGYITQERSLSDFRALNALEAESAFVDGREEPLLDEAPVSASLREDLAHLPRGLALVLLGPLPWEQDGSRARRLARAGNLVWYPLLLLAVLGVAALPSHRRSLGYVTLITIGILLVSAVTEGNAGTAVRHRGEAELGVVLLAVAGVEVLRSRSRRSAMRTTDVDGADTQLHSDTQSAGGA